MPRPRANWVCKPFPYHLSSTWKCFPYGLPVIHSDGDSEGRVLDSSVPNTRKFLRSEESPVGKSTPCRWGTDALVHGEREVPALAWPALELLHGEVLASDGSALEELDDARGIVPRAHGDHRFLRELRSLGVAVADDVVATWVGTGGNRVVSTRGDSCFGLAVAIGKCAPIG